MLDAGQIRFIFSHRAGGRKWGATISSGWGGKSMTEKL
jgi:hypothetical protein